MTKIDHKFAEALQDAEEAAELALTKYSKLMLAAQDARVEEGLQFGEVQAVYSDISEVMTFHLRGRAHLMRAHAKALEIGQRRGLVTAVGDTIPTYEKARDEAPPVALRAVA